MVTTIPDQPTSTSPDNPVINKMVSPGKDTIFADSGTRTARIPEGSGEAVSPSTEAEILVRALRNVITPLVHPANGGSKHDMNQKALGPDGEQFVIALKKFMSSFLHQRGPEGGIEVELEEKGADTQPNEGPQATSNDDLIPNNVMEVALETEPPRNISVPEESTSAYFWSILPFHNEESPDTMMIFFGGSASSISHTDRYEKRKAQFIEKVLTALREHVFNSMPIRLLCFKPDNSKLRITLVERGEIYAHIAARLNNINFEDVSQNITLNLRLAESEGFEPGEQDPVQQVIHQLIREYSRYAILSHTWLRGAFREITYGDWIRREFDAQQPGFRKLINFCRTAWKDYGITFGWMDTICINKESSSELDESIRSMYKWYNSAHICITYLAETKMLPDMHNDSWFTRGWTLQELIAPSNIKFYNAYWGKLVESEEYDKDNSVIVQKIEEATTITAHELRYPIRGLSISRKMQMAAMRQVTREEDSAYSLMGILGVSMATAYGEGAERAFSRLLQEVLNSSTDGVADIFNWAGSNHSHISCLLPSRLQDYLHRFPGPFFKQTPIEPIMLTHLGLRITILLMPAISIKNPTELRPNPFGDYYGIADISAHPAHASSLAPYERVLRIYGVLDARISDGDGWDKDKKWLQLTLGVLNVGDSNGGGEIIVPVYCLAVGLRFDRSSSSTLRTEAPITFALKKRHHSGRNTSVYHIKRGELESHGMKLATMVL